MKAIDYIITNYLDDKEWNIVDRTPWHAREDSVRMLLEGKGYDYEKELDTARDILSRQKEIFDD